MQLARSERQEIPVFSANAAGFGKTVKEAEDSSKEDNGATQ
jgi:hypothetical protein